jgi:uncharacterized protein YjbJ (UPF0337 family)
MNKHELSGDVRYAGGKVEKAVGDLVGNREMQANGVKNQVAGGAENLIGRAQAVAGDVADATASLIDRARDRAADLVGRSGKDVGGKDVGKDLRDGADKAEHELRHGARKAEKELRRGAKRAEAAVRGDAPVWAVIAALAGGYAIGALIHGRRA